MEPLNFIYWLQGYLELQDPKTIDGPKVQMIKDHLGLVLNKVTPDRHLKTLEKLKDEIQKGKPEVINMGEHWLTTRQIEEEAAKDAFFSSGGTIKFPYQNPPASC